MTASLSWLRTRRLVRAILTSTVALGLASSTASLAVTPLAMAAPTEPAVDPTAAALKAEGDAAMLENNFEDALAKYEQAYEKSKNPALLYNRGRALQGLSRFPEALDLIKQFEKDAPPELKAKVPKLAELIADLDKHVSVLVITVNQSGASVRLGDKVLGTTPLGQLRVNSGRAKLEVSKDGFSTETRNVELVASRTIELAVDLIPKNRSGVLVISSPVKEARVAVDGKPVGNVPAEVPVLAGTHTVLFEASGYNDNTVQVVVSAGQTRTVDIEPGHAPFYKQGWFWGTVGGVLATGAAVGIVYAATTEGDPDRGTIDPGIVPVRFHLLSPAIHF